MNELDFFSKMSEISDHPQEASLLIQDDERAQLIAEHKLWLKSIRHERPSPAHHFKIGIYIRYFNQTKYDNYLDYHKKQFLDTIALCPRWELVDFYIDEGNNAPRMENAPEWKRLLQDCFDQKVDLIITQKVSNVSRNPMEMSFCCKVLATLPKPVGIYFISEDIYSMASYYMEDLRETEFFPEEGWQILPDTEEEKQARFMLHD